MSSIAATHNKDFEYTLSLIINRTYGDRSRGLTLSSGKTDFLTAVNGDATALTFTKLRMKTL